MVHSQHPHQQELAERTIHLFQDHRRNISQSTDRLFAALMFFQWSGSILAGNFVLPHTWIGATSDTSRHLRGCIVLGAVVTAVAVACALARPGRKLTRHVIAVAQMLMAGILIHEFGGRIETHFYVFGSLAFLAFYRDWTVLVSATVVTSLDHMIRGTWWPQSIFGVADSSSWRWVEHVGLLLFADVFLIRSCMLSVQEMRDIAARRAALEATNEIIESEVRQRTAELNRAREVAESANRAKTVFLENVTHELRTPMNGIMGMTELALDTALTDEQQEYLMNVRASAQALLWLLNDVLDFSAIEAGKLEMAPAEFRLRKRIRQSLEEMRPQAESKGLRLICDVAADVPDALLADDRRLAQLLGKLIDNAIKFTTEGQIGVRVRLVGTQQDPLDLHFTVSDTGIGILPEKLETIFQPFEQADTSSTRQFGGAGLGLAVASQLVRAMGGRIWVESTMGEGSVFHFTLRCRRAGTLDVQDTGRDLEEAASPEMPPERKLRILLAEDNPVNQAYALRTLTKQGHSVAVANNGEEAVHIWDQEPIDLVLMDLQMPVVDGLQAATEIRRREEGQGSHTPIIAVTAHADREQCQAAGMDGYVAKPIQAEQLFAEIARVTGRYSAAAPHDTTEAESAAAVSLDETGLLERVHHDREFLAELVGLFAEDGRELLAELSAAVASRNGAALARAAHTFKGMAGSLCAHTAMQLALELETIGKEEDFERAAQLLDELEQEVARVTEALNDLLER